MSYTFHMRVNVKPLANFSNEVQQALPGIVKRHALAIQAKAAKNAPVDTGALKNSIQALPDQSDPLRWTVQDGVVYGIYQELGTPPRAKKPHFLGNACETQAEKFFKEIMEALKG